jgi:hypothetical protein
MAANATPWCAGLALRHCHVPPVARARVQRPHCRLKVRRGRAWKAAVPQHPTAKQSKGACLPVCAGRALLVQRHRRTACSGVPCRTCTMTGLIRSFEPPSLENTMQTAVPWNRSGKSIQFRHRSRIEPSPAPMVRRLA